MKRIIKKWINKNRVHLDGEIIAFSLGIIILTILLISSTPRKIGDKKLAYIDDYNFFEKTNNSHNSSNNNQKESKVSQVTVYRNSGSIINIPIEDYLIGVVGAEMPASFPIEALKAQAIVARTYVLKKIQEGKKLTDTVSTQSYKDDKELKKLWGSQYEKYYQKIKEAVESTKDLVIYYQEELIDAVYHSTSNGKTEDSVYVWGSEIPYLKSVDSSWDRKASSYSKTVMKDFKVVMQLLGLETKNACIEILSRDTSGRVLKIKVGNKELSGVEFRNLLGLRSTDFDFSIEGGNIFITTRGFGHGVGMSQYGAGEMAKEGYQYDEILKHYYTGISIHES